MIVTEEGVVYKIRRDKYNKFNDSAVAIRAEDKNAESLTINSTVYGAKVTAIGYEAFAHMQNLETVFTADLDSLLIDNYAFAFCPKLKVLHSSASEITIRQNAFQCCDSLVNLWCKGYVKLHISNCFINCPKLTDVGTLLIVTEGCFVNCPQLKALSFHDKVAIRGNIFKNTKIEEVFCYGDVLLHENAQIDMFLDKEIHCKSNSNMAELAYEGANVHFW